MTLLENTESPKVITHKGTYGNSYQPSDDDEDKPVSGEKRGRGRPKKNADSTGHVPSHKMAKNAPAWLTGGPFKAPKSDAKNTKKHTLKDWFDKIDARVLAEAEEKAEKEEKKDDKKPETKKEEPKKAEAKKEAPKKEASDSKKSDTPDGEPTQGAKPPVSREVAKTLVKQLKKAYDSQDAAAATQVEEDTSNLTIAPVKPGAMDIKDKKGKTVATAKNPQAAELVRKGDLTISNDDELQEGDQPSCATDVGAGLGAGRSQKALEEAKAKKDKTMDKKDKKSFDKDDIEEGKKPEFWKKDGKKDDKKVDKKDSKKEKEEITEGAEHKLQAAHHAGKAHALAKHAYACHCDDPEEAQMYHEGYKEGLDDLYCQLPPVALPSGPTVHEDPFGTNAGPAHTPIGGLQHNKVFDAVAFESLDKQLNEILAEDKVEEGLTVSISKGQQGSPDTVSVNATDADSDQLLALVKTAGLGVFAPDQASDGYGAPSQEQPAAVPAADGAEAVVGDNDSMLDLIRKVTDQEGGAEGVVGMDVTPASGGEAPAAAGTEVVAAGDSETPDQAEEEVAEMSSDDTAGNGRTVPDDIQETEVEEGHSDTAFGADAEMRAGAASDDEAKAPAVAPSGDRNEEGKGQLDFTEEIDEDLANGAEDTFEADFEFLTRVISGGLNKQKATGQTTVPVVATQASRLGNPMSESTDLLHDWKKLSGIIQ